MEREVNLYPYTILLLVYDYKIVGINDVTVIIEKDGDYYYIREDIEVLEDISIMPSYIKEDWINSNKNNLNIAVLNSVIFHIENAEKPEEYNKIIELLKPMRRDLIMNGLI